MAAVDVAEENTDLDTSTEAPSAEDTQTENPNEGDNKPSPATEDNVDWKKRYSDQQRYVTKLQNDINKLKADVVEASKKPLELPKTKEQLDEYKKQYPDLFDTIISLARLEASERAKDIDKEFQELNKKMVDLESEKLILEVAKVHRDAVQIKKDPKFHQWLSEQTESVFRLFESNNPKDPIKGLYLYKEDMGIKTDKQRKSEAATEVPVKGAVELPKGEKKVWKASEVAKLSRQDYQKYKSDIIEALATPGRYIKDV